jgi:hypothetical protein
MEAELSAPCLIYIQEIKHYFRRLKFLQKQRVRAMWFEPDIYVLYSTKNTIIYLDLHLYLKLKISPWYSFLRGENAGESLFLMELWGVYIHILICKGLVSQDLCTMHRSKDVWTLSD